MPDRNKLITFAGIAVFVIAGIAATRLSQGKYKNLKILPQDITVHQMDSIMGSYNTALGVNCKFCHSSYTGFPDSLDYASDINPMKEEARLMLRMTIDINSKYFYHNKAIRPVYLTTVTCNTCHKGEPFPE